MKVVSVIRSTQKKVKPEVAKELMDKLRKEHAPLVKGKFEFVEAKGGILEFNYRFFPEDLLVRYRFVHNEICEVTMGLVKHLNNTVQKIRSIGLQDGSERGGLLPDRGVPTTFEKNSRVRFIPLDVL